MGARDVIKGDQESHNVKIKSFPIWNAATTASCSVLGQIKQENTLDRFNLTYISKPDRKILILFIFTVQQIH